MGQRILLEFEYVYHGNRITLENWVKTLSQEEQDRFFKARENNYAARQVAIDQGRMTITKDNNYVWANEQEYHKNKEHDPVFVDYFNRYLKENNIEFKQHVKYVDE